MKNFNSEIGSNHLYNTLQLLMMGIMVPETRWTNNKFCSKEPSVASSWPFYFHVLTTMHGQTHIKFIFHLTIYQAWFLSLSTPQSKSIAFKTITKPCNFPKRPLVN